MMEISSIYFLEQFEYHPKWDCHRIFFDGLRIHIGFSCLYNPRNNATRVLYLFILFACIIFTITVSSTLLQFMASPILSPQVETIQEIIDEQFSLIGGPFEYLKMTQQSEVKIFPIIKKKRKDSKFYSTLLNNFLGLPSAIVEKI